MTTISLRLIENARPPPERTSVRLMHPQAPDEVITCQGLLDGAAGYARALEKAGVPAGEVVILILQHSADLVYSFFGCMLHGSIPSIMPFLTEKLSPEQYRKSLVSLFEISSPAAVITYPEFESEVRKAIRPDGSVRTVLLTSDIVREPGVSFEGLQGLRCEEEDIAFLQHSSGTTGLQKGVALSHRAFFNQLDSYADALRLSESDVIASWLPLYHDMGLVAGFLIPILGRIPVVMMSPFDWVRAPYRLMQAVSDHKATLSWLPNFAYNFCAQKIRARHLEGVDLSSWRAISNCSEPVHTKSHQMFLERFQAHGLRAEALATCYAMAENVFAVTQAGIDGPVTRDSISQREFFGNRTARPAAQGEPAMTMLSCGRPITNTRVKIVDDRRQNLPERILGEIALQSDCMLTGYYHRDDLTVKAFHDGWYLTGDLGYMADGEVYVTGRKKDLIIVGGKNVYPQDLETLAGDVPGVHPGRAVAFGVFDEEMGTEEVVIVAETDLDPSEGDWEKRTVKIAAEIRNRVNSGSDIVVRDALVVERGWLLKTSSGKIARNANRDKYLEKNAAA